MKPVNLLPKGNGPAVAAEPQKLNLGVIGGIAGAVVVLLGVGGYLALARVDTVKSETAKAVADQTAAQNEITQVQATTASVGPPVTDSDKQLADDQVKTLVAAYGERYNYVELTRELSGIMQGSGGWYSSVKINSVGSTDGSAGTGGAGGSVTIDGYMPTMELAAGFEKRVEGTRSMSTAVGTKFESKRLIDRYTKKPTTYYHFVVTATFDDNIAPTADGSTPVDTGTGTTVSDGGSGEITLSLDSEPTPVKTTAQIAAEKAAKAKKQAAAIEAAKPKNPFAEVADEVAGGTP